MHRSVCLIAAAATAALRLSAADIPARGGVIEDGAGDVAVTSAGADGAGAIRLDATSVTVSSLVQRSATDATVDLEGGTLAADRVAVEGSESASLTVGASVGDGTLAAAVGPLVLANAATNGARLLVRSALGPADAALVKRGPGEVAVESPFMQTGDVSIEEGTLAVSNATTLSATLSGAGTFAKDGDARFTMPAGKHPAFTGEILFRAGTNGFANNSCLYGNAYRFSFAEGTTLDQNTSCYEMGDTEISIAGDGVDGQGVVRVTKSGTARAFTFLTLTGDASVDIAYNTQFQLGCNSYNKKFGRFDMNGHRLLKRAGEGYLRFENGAITNAGEIVLDHYTGTKTYGNYMIVRTNYCLGGPGAPEIVLGTNSTLILSGAGSQSRGVRATGSGASVLVEPGKSAADRNVWQGISVPAADHSLRISGYLGAAADDPGWDVTFEGPLAGTGTLIVAGSADSRMGRVTFGSETGSFTGPLSVKAQYVTPVAEHPGFLPAYTNVTVEKGVFSLSAANWAVADIERFFAQATRTDGARVGLDAAAGEAPVVTGLTAPTDDSMYMATGEGVVTVASPEAEKLRLGALDGTMRVAGPDRVTLRDVAVEGAHSGERTGTFVIDGGADVALDLTNGAAFFIGSQAQYRASPARAVISNASALAWSVRNGVTNNTEAASGAIAVGGYSTGILEIGAGAAVTNRLTVGGRNPKSRGAVYQRGGHFANLGFSGNSTSAGIGLSNGLGAVGYYELTGGTYEPMGGQSIASGGSTGILRVDGGTLRAARRPANCDSSPGWTPVLYIANNGHAVVDIVKGLARFVPTYIYTCAVAGSTAVISLTGPEAEMEVSSKPNCGYAKSTRTVFNLNDGARLTAPGIERYRTPTTSGYGTTRVFVNFDGGIFEWSNVGGHLFGDPGMADGKGGAAVDVVSVYSGGARIQINSGVTATASRAFTAPAGNGVSAVHGAALAAVELIAPPRIEIAGDGEGATAYADFDSRTGRVTGIRVTSRGWNYTAATATAYDGDVVLAENLAVTLTPNVGGGLTKEGAGTLLLAATNTYAGATVVKAGVLKAGCDRALPEGTELVLAGGTADLGGYDFTFGGVSGEAGTVVNGSVRIGGEWSVDCADLVAGRVPVLAGEAEILPGTVLRLENAGLLDENARYPVLTFSAGTLSGAGNLSAELPPYWKCFATPSGVAIRQCRALQLFVR